MNFLRNAWYVAAMSTEVDPTALFHRKILNTSVLIYRKADGTPVAIRTPLDAIKAGDATGAQALIRQHLSRTLARVDEIRARHPTFLK